jgi:hypothetical protein
MSLVDDVVWYYAARAPVYDATAHSKLDPGAPVLSVDELPYEGCAKRRDSQGNTLEEGVLPDGRKFEIVKNFPGESEVRAVLADIAQNVTYFERPAEKSWNVMYNVKK